MHGAGAYSGRYIICNGDDFFIPNNIIYQIGYFRVAQNTKY
jgi:hypothetical protein